jgi:hypothetical protein
MNNKTFNQQLHEDALLLLKSLGNYKPNDFQIELAKVIVKGMKVNRAGTKSTFYK